MYGNWKATPFYCTVSSFNVARSALIGAGQYSSSVQMQRFIGKCIQKIEEINKIKRGKICHNLDSFSRKTNDSSSIAFEAIDEQNENSPHNMANLLVVEEIDEIE